MVGWHHWLNGQEFGWTLGVGNGQGGLACCGSWGRKELDMTEWLNWTDTCICAHMHVCACVCGVFSSSIDIFYGCTSQMTIAQLPSMMSIWPMGNLLILSTPDRSGDCLPAGHPRPSACHLSPAAFSPPKAQGKISNPPFLIIALLLMK